MQAHHSHCMHARHRYTRIAKHPTVLQVYSDTLRKRRVLDDDAIQQATKDVDAMLAQKLQESEQ